MKCMLCPRNCETDRRVSKGYCGEGNIIKAARASLHMWEEPCISGEEGSGTVFFSGCSLKCVYCQNKSISIGKIGKEISVDRLAEIFLELQSKKANNINLVTGDHFIPQIIEAIKKAKNNGLHIPIVFNTSSYISVDTVKALRGYVDIFLADFKYWESETGQKYSNAPDYPEAAKAAIEQMAEQTGEPLYDSRGMMKKGVIVRHMILPGYTAESKKIIEYVFKKYGNKVILSIMNQYTPINMESYSEINRKVTEQEYDEVIDYALSIGVEEAFIQEEGTQSESFIPDFNIEGI